MDTTKRTQLIKQRAVARGMLKQIQNFIEVGDYKINEIQVRFNKLRDFLTDMTLHKMNWNYQMTQTIQVIENYLKININILRQNSVSLYILL